MYKNILTSIILIIINNNYNILYNFSNINYINIYLLLSFISLNFNTRHLQGTSYRNNIMLNYYILFLSKLNFILFLYSNFFIFNKNFYVNNIFLLYLPSYLEFSEFTGNRKLYLYNPFLKFFSLFIKSIGYYKIINTNECLEKNKQYLIGIHPHGLFPIGTLGCLGLPICENIKHTVPIILSNNLFIGIASFCFYVPLLRDFFLAIGAVDCSKPIIEKFIKNGYSIVLFVGGAEEAKFSDYGNTNLILKSRKGFFKLAIQNNITLLPIYTFGNNNIYKSYDKDFYNIFYFFKRLTGIWFPRGKIILKKNNYISVIGKEIIVEKKLDYNNDNIIDLQNKYIINLNEIYEKYKYLDLGIKDKSLIIN